MKQMDDSRSTLGSSPQEPSNPRPADALPHEVLANIFALASASTLCASKRELSDCLLVISAVCKQWRLIAIGTKILWSHIDVGFCECNDNKRTLRISDASLLWLRRAKGTPIHLHFWENPILGHLPIPGFTETLELHAVYISALTFSGIHTETVVRDTLDLFARRTVPNIPKTLTIRKVFRDEGIQLRLTWPIASLCGLTRLQIGLVSEGIRMNLRQLMTIISNSPSLRVLRLKEIEGSLPEQEELPTVHLPALQMLSLSYITGPTLLQLLSILALGALDLHVKLRISCETDTLAAIRAFLKRSNVSSLTLRHEITELAADLFHLPNLHTLYLDLVFGNIPTLSLLVDPTPEGHLLPKYPSIRHIGLIRGNLQPSAQDLIKQIFEAYRLIGFSYMGTSCRYYGSRPPKELFEDWLKKRFGAPVIVDYLQDSDREWGLNKGETIPWVG
ncbi:hypothetical protein FS749_011846 [Ceratobasidium sp. UAMH 11750]|nr:hypothetical protein FS749_011846 [Ceratobasidium sp. UAMH 11750]